ncbi:MAG: hypothetical protein JNM69_28095 [Archangium sp.]|nr:hypothetical protein [Archangium sp.]
MRFALMGLLALGVVGGYGSAFAHAAHWRAHGGCHGQQMGGWHDGRFQDDRWGNRFEERAEVKQAAPAAQPQTVVVQSPAPAAAPAPQIYVIMPGAQQAPAVQPQTIVIPAAVQQQAAPQAGQ